MSVDRNVGQVTVLRSTESILYTWDDPNGSRKVEWKSYKGEEDPMEVVVDKVTWRRVYDLLVIAKNGCHTCLKNPTESM